MQTLKCHISGCVPALLLKLGEVTSHLNSIKIARGNSLKFLMEFTYWFATFILSSTLLTGWCSMPDLSNVVPHSHVNRKHMFVYFFMFPTDITMILSLYDVTDSMVYMKYLAKYYSIEGVYRWSKQMETVEQLVVLLYDCKVSS